MISNIDREKDQLLVLERQYEETLKEMESCEDKVRAEMLRRRSQEEQDAIDNQRFLVDNLEFQQLEVCSSLACSAIFIHFSCMLCGEIFCLAFMNDRLPRKK